MRHVPDLPFMTGSGRSGALEALPQEAEGIHWLFKE